VSAADEMRRERKSRVRTRRRIGTACPNRAKKIPRGRQTAGGFPVHGIRGNPLPDPLKKKLVTRGLQSVRCGMVREKNFDWRLGAGGNTRIPCLSGLHRRNGFRIFPRDNNSVIIRGLILRSHAMNAPAHPSSIGRRRKISEGGKKIRRKR